MRNGRCEHKGEDQSFLPRIVLDDDHDLDDDTCSPRRIRETNCGMKRKRGRVQGRNPSFGSYIAITIKDIKDNEDKEVYQDQEGFPISCFMHHQPYRLSSLPLSLDMIYARLPSLPIPIQKSAQRWTIPIQNGLCSFKVSQLNPPTRKTIHC